MKRILALILALLLLCSCAVAPKTGRVSEEELATLREAYPYYDGIHSAIDGSMAEYQKPETIFDFFLAREYGQDPFILAEICVVSEPYYTISWNNYTGQFKDLDAFRQQYSDLDEKSASAIFAYGEQQVNARLTDILWGSNELTENVAFSLMLPKTQPPDTVKVFQKGGRLICILVPAKFPLAGSFPVLPHFSSKYLTWHITENDVILSATSEPGPDSFSGLYLESFKQEVLAILNEE